MFDLVSHAVFILIFILSALDLVRYRDLPRFEVVAGFGTLAIVILVDAAGRVLSKPELTVGPVMAMVLLVHPYLLLRLVHHFPSIPLGTPGHRSVGGTGLRLAICKQIIEGLGGQIWATSDGSGRGGTFGMTLPITTPITESASAESPTRIAVGRILLRPYPVGSLRPCGRPEEQGPTLSAFTDAPYPATQRCRFCDALDS
jgi:hypothetical protein